MNLPTLWSRDVKGTAAVNTLINKNGTYVGSNGYVYRLDSQTGKIQSTQGLSGYGNYEVRLAVSEDGSLFIIGTNRYVVSLDPISLNITWYTKIPNLGGDVSVIVSAGNIYAGIAGSAFRLDLSGNITARGGVLAGAGETRISLSDQGTILFVGVDGYAAAYKTPNMDASWTKKLQNGDGPTTVLKGGASDVLVGCAGYVWRLDEVTGSVAAVVDVGDRAGYREIHLALNDSRKRLFAGTNGYAFGLDANLLANQYFTSLPSTNYNITDVVAKGETAFFASRGRVFQLDAKGDIIGENDLPGFGNGNISVTLRGPDRLIVGPDGYVLELAVLQPGFEKAKL